MKKLKLNLDELRNAEVLSREQLKKVFGGAAAGGSNSGSGPCENKASTIYCRNGAGVELGHVDRTGCPASGEEFDTACGQYESYSRAESTCTC